MTQEEIDLLLWSLKTIAWTSLAMSATLGFIAGVLMVKAR